MDIRFTIDAVLPLFLIVLAGMGLRRLLSPTREQVMMVNRLVFYLLLPCQLFQNARELDFSLITDPWPYLLAVGGYVVITFVMMRLSPAFIKDAPRCGAFVHSAVRPNAVLLGLPLATALYGAQALPAELMCVLMLPLVNLLGVVILSRGSPGGGGGSIKGSLKSIATNPLIIALAFGFLFSALKLEIPAVVSKPLASLSAAASPLAMLNIGLSLELRARARDRRPVLLASALRLLVFPVLMTALSVLLGLRGILLFAVYLVYAVPTAANNGLICAAMGADDGLANAVTLLTTLASPVTLVAGISLLQGLSLI